MQAEDPRGKHLERLVRDGLLEPTADGTFAPTRRWHAAVRRAAARLVAQGRRDGDLRVPLALALVEIYGDQADPSKLCGFVEVLLEIETRVLRSSGLA